MNLELLCLHIKVFARISDTPEESVFSVELDTLTHPAQGRSFMGRDVFAFRGLTCRQG